MQEIKVKNLGFVILLLINIWIALLGIIVQLVVRNTNAQVQMSATVEKSEYYKCLEQCEQIVDYY